MDSRYEAAPLNIRTVSAGFYEGFNPIVSMSAKFLIALIVTLLLAWPDASAHALGELKQFTLTTFAGWYVYLMAAFVGFCLLIVVLPASGRIKLGRDESIPDHSTKDWLCMMFCAGIGVGILVFSVSEPISHFATNPDILEGRVVAGSAEGVASSMRFVFLHWGLSAWGCYAIIGMALGLACHRHGQPMTIRSALAPIFGQRLEGPLGHLIDTTAILAIIAGITTTIVLGLEQICSGLSALTGSPFFADHAGDPPLTALLTALVVAISVAIASIVSGVDRGVKWVSQIGILLAFGVLVVFVLYGTGARVFSIFVDGTLRYLATLPAQITTLYTPNGFGEVVGQRDWQGQWTIFYWAWWIAFAPFVGLFLARISRGRTLREFILGAMLGPTAMCFIWFSATGGTALLFELNGVAEGRITNAAHANRIYETVDLMLSPGPAMLIKAALALLFLILIIASSTAAIIAIKSIGAAGSAHAETPLHSMTWAVVIAAITGAVMSVNGVASIRDVMIVGAVPFSVIMALMALSVARMLFWNTVPPLLER
ncbi:MAG: BCCT family transporter [Boseongicola sp.]|nr:BCCT family transporter [Boseongicola sp.]